MNWILTRACRWARAQVDLHREGLTPGNALELAGSYDVIVDATDNAASRYLLSDACAVLNRPLVSGAALGTDGQLTVYCHGPDGACTLPLLPLCSLLLLGSSCHELFGRSTAQCSTRVCLGQKGRG